ncbi:zinc finger, CCHC-type containing protein [Tanacetum coccineum]|uniref:Zinc finger, CCHC-type containing protein n=1 Tax=Tanacetum coccineum TaxID=301880 RepID=A0ABQ5AZD3_9ASTR
MRATETPLTFPKEARRPPAIRHHPVGAKRMRILRLKFFQPERTAKLQNDILMFQQHKDESLYNAWNRFKDLLRKVRHHGLDLWLQVQIFYDHVNYATQMAIDYAADDRLRKLRLEVT